MSYDFLPTQGDLEATLAPVGRHRGTANRFKCNVVDRIATAVGQGAQVKLEPFLLPWASDTRMLRMAWDTLATRGNAPGPDGLTYADLQDEEVWARLKGMSKSVRDGSYRRGPVRTILFLKDRLDAERGHRQITLPNVMDRVLQRAIVQTLQPLLDPLFGDQVLGFRPRKDRFQALILAEQITFTRKATWWITEDLRDAFDNVPLGRLRDVLHVYCPSSKLVDLIIELVGAGQACGIQQGGPLSPLLLNLYLHHHLDTPWKQRCPDVPLLRYADDLLLPCTSPAAAKKAWTKLHELLLPTGLQVKGSDASAVTVRLTKTRAAEWLGFRVRKVKDRLAVDVAEKSWSRLSERLSLSHDMTNSPVRAISIIQAWIRQLGPCHFWVDRDKVVERIQNLALDAGFDELPKRRSLLKNWRVAGDRWNEMRNTFLYGSDRGPVQFHPPTIVSPGGNSTGDEVAPF